MLYFLEILHKVSPSDTICISNGIKVLDLELLRGIKSVSFNDNKSVSR
jgi:hypothetical protein